MMITSSKPLSYGKPKCLACLVCINSAYLGQFLQEIQLPKDCFLLGIVRRKSLIFAGSNPMICEGDWLLAVALKSSSLLQLRTILKRTRPISWRDYDIFPWGTCQMFT